MKTPGRNEPCPCGVTGLKFKHCCINKPVFLFDHALLPAVWDLRCDDEEVAKLVFRKKWEDQVAAQVIPEEWRFDEGKIEKEELESLKPAKDAKLGWPPPGEEA